MNNPPIMQFTSPPVVNRMPGVMPLLGVSLLSALLVLAMVCFSLSREEETVRLPAGTLPRPPLVRDMPTISVRLSRQGAVTLGGQTIADAALATAWQGERAALRKLGFEPAQATVVVRADRDVPTDKVQRLIEKAQEAGFSRCVLRPKAERIETMKFAASQRHWWTRGPRPTNIRWKAAGCRCWGWAVC